MSARTDEVTRLNLSKDIKQSFVAFFLISMAVLLAYSNTFNASWHFDDYHNIVDNPNLHIENLHPKTLYKTFFASSNQGRYLGNRLRRPVSNLTFALNWYMGKDAVTGYHVVNIVVHILAAMFLFLCSYNILKSPNLNNKFEKDRYLIALISSTIWAVHPIQTQAVTYIVQRMASLSAMFGILSLWLYVSARNTPNVRRRVVYFLGSVLACIFAVGSKQNGVLILAGMVLIEFIFYQDLSREKIKRILIWGPVICLLLLVIGALYLHAKNVLSGYEIRSFTLIQRLMTEPRVMWLYISQIFWPLPGRFSISHDVIVSISLIRPWTTMPAILALSSLVVLGAVNVRKRPITAFAILFFLLNHLVESTVIPLELVFEHRNYLPTAFLFLPISQGIVYLLKSFRGANRYLSGISLGGLSAMLLFLIASTFLRNDVWATEKTLWENAIKNAPGISRPYQNLAYHYFEPIGRYDIALALYQKALTLRMETPQRSRAHLLTNIGAIHDKAGEYSTAYDYYMRSLDISPKELMPRYNAARALIGMNRLEEALEMIDDLISKKPEDKDINNLKGKILLKMARPDEAIPYLEKSLDSDPLYYNALINMGISLCQKGEYESSKKMLEAAHMQAPGQGLPLFCLIENRLRANDAAGADTYLQKLLDSVRLDEIDMVLKSIGKNHLLVPMSYEILAPFIEEKIGEVQTKEK